MRLKSWFVTLYTQKPDGDASPYDTLEIEATTREGAISIALAGRVVSLDRLTEEREPDKLVRVDVSPMGTDGG